MAQPGDRSLVLAVADSAFGPVRVAAGDRGVVALSLATPAEDFEAGLVRRRLGSPVRLEEAPAGPAHDLAAKALEIAMAMLDGEPASVASLPVDLADLSTWDRLVLDAVRAIPRGETSSYGEVARRIGRAGAARAVGGAVGRNPVGLIVPCHRVIAGDGTLGGYGVAAWGGREAALDLKRDLLALEGVEIARRVSAG